MVGWKTWIVAGIAVAVLASCGDEDHGGGLQGAVDGFVLSGLRAPVLGAVVILGKDYAHPVITDALGTFHFDEVPSTYDLTVLDGGGLLEYHGLTRRDPMVAEGVVGLAPHNARVVGGVTGATLPLASDESIHLGLTGDAYNMGQTHTDGSIDAVLSWFGPPHWEGDLVAVHIRENPDETLAFLAAGRQALVLDEGDEVSDVMVDLTTVPVETGSTTLSFGAGDNLSVGMSSFTVMGARFHRNRQMNVTDGAEITFPSEGGTLYLSQILDDGTFVTIVRKAVLGGTTQLDVPATAALEAVLPVEGAKGVSPTPTLQWTPVSGADLYMVVVQGSGHVYNYVLPAGTTTLEFPDYGELGMALDSGTAVTWGVRAVDIDGLTPDEAASPAGKGIGLVVQSVFDEAVVLQSGLSTFTVGTEVLP